MSNRSPAQCQHLAIARNGAGQVAICPDCNVVHVELACMTLRFTPDSFRCLAALLASAQVRLDRVCANAPAARVDEPPGGGTSLH